MSKPNLNTTISSHNHLIIARQREKEEKLYDQLHKSLYTLTLCYKTTSDFKACFKQGMFAKPNPNGCQHIMHFLLTIIDAAKFKKNVDWPVLDKKMEALFRTQLRSYLSKLALDYPKANIPPVQLSYLITPGGFKFCRMLFQIVELAMVVHIQKRNTNNTVHLISKEPDAIEIGIILELMEKSKKRALSQFNIRRLIFERAAEQASILIAENEKVVELRRLKELKFKQVIDNLTFLSPENRLQFLDESIIPIWKAHIDSLKNEVEKLSTDVENVATLCEETERYAIILTSKSSRPCLEYNNTITDLKPLMRIVQGENRTCVDNILCNGKLHLPNLLNSLNSVFTSVMPIMEHNKITYGSKNCLNVLEEKVKEMKECCSSYVKFDVELNQQIQTTQKSIDKALSDCEMRWNKTARSNPVCELVVTPVICLKPAASDPADTHWLNYNFVKSKLNLKMLPNRETFRIRRAISSRTPRSINHTQSFNRSLNYSSIGKIPSRSFKNHSINKSYKRGAFNDDLRNFLANSVRKIKKNYSRIDESFETSIYKTQSSPCIRKLCLTSNPATPGRIAMDQDCSKTQTPISFKLLNRETPSPLTAHHRFSASKERQTYTPRSSLVSSFSQTEEVTIMTTPVTKRTSTPNSYNLDDKINFLLVPDMKDIVISDKESSPSTSPLLNTTPKPMENTKYKSKSRPSLEMIINRFKNIKSLRTVTQQTCSSLLKLDDANLENISDNFQILDDTIIDVDRNVTNDKKKIDHIDSRRFSLTKLISESDYEVNNLSMPLNVSLDSD